MHADFYRATILAMRVPLCLCILFVGLAELRTVCDLIHDAQTDYPSVTRMRPVYVYSTYNFDAHNKPDACPLPKLFRPGSNRHTIDSLDLAGATHKKVPSSLFKK